MSVILPAGKNRVPNPLFSDNTGVYFASNNTVAGTYSTEGRFTGQLTGPNPEKTIKIVVHTAGQTFIYVGIARNVTYAAPISPNELYSISAFVRAGTPGISADLRANYYDAGMVLRQNRSSTPVPLTPGEPVRLTMDGFLAGSLAAYAAPYVAFSKTDGTPFQVGDTFYFGASQVNDGATVDHFIHGNEGPLYSWEGTVFRSASLRAESVGVGPIGTGGVIDVHTHIYKADRNNTLGEDISPYVLDASWDWDIDRDGPKGTLKLRLLEHDRVKRFEWVAVFLDVEYEDGTVESGQLGLFRVEVPDEEYGAEVVEIEVSGFDPMVILSDRTLESTVSIPPGTNIVETIRTYLDAAGLRHAIPDSAAVAPAAGISGKVHTKWSTFLNELAADAGYYALHPDSTGRIVTKPVVANIGNEQPAFVYTIGRNSRLVGDISFKPNDQSIFNRVVVVRDDPAQGTELVAVRSYDDPDSPVSTVNMGVRSKTYSLQNAADQAAVDAYADLIIQNRTMYVYAELETIPTPFYRPYSVVELRFTGNTYNPELGHHDGKYTIKSVSFDLIARNGTMDVKLRRVEWF